MSFSRPDAWVWDFWTADDGEVFHLFYLFAPRSLEDPDLRHRHARIGHAESRDLLNWTDRGEVLAPGPAGALDETATWTGSVVRGPDNLWRMFYTGAAFISPDSVANIETIGVALSADLHTWTKATTRWISADPRWYELIGAGEWKEEAWRDPWVFPDPAGDGWHMLVTARAAGGQVGRRGVVGHAWSADLDRWVVKAPLSPPSGFDHLEVLQHVEVEGSGYLLFSATADVVDSSRFGGTGGVWVVEAPSPLGPFDIDGARLLVDDRLYSGRIVRDRAGAAMLLAVETGGQGQDFIGRISDPIPVGVDENGRLALGDVVQKERA